MTEDEMVKWHHQLNGYEFDQAPGDREGQGSLACCSPWRHRVRHDLATKEQQQSLNENKIETITVYCFKLGDIMTHFKTGN